ncbi:phage terminase small subunit P27 family [Aquabacter sp. L1I39]|uniref:phage terminase small subunit P27 family n=1 Tax=Aquabacter sp. L1I39 TaxID=2820278 RepID=UPI001ADAD0FB|nr:phage terminase small subunit P27 family [Aquabacter sp. L1I39]QTL03145.1 phage terminase small subunit P27 family [Aquabacter sp. L1I39]
MKGRKPKETLPGSSPVTSLPTPPTWLSRDAKGEWRRVAPILINERRTLTVADLAMLESYCTAVGLVAEASRIIAKEGLIYMSATGPKKHPAVAIRSDGMTQARQIASELGLTPASRSRPAVRNDDDQDAPDLDL